MPGHQDMRAAAARAEQAARGAAEAEAKRRDGDLWKSVRKLVGSRAFQARCIEARQAFCGRPETAHLTAAVCMLHAA